MWLGLHTACSSQASHTSYMVAGLQEAGSGSAWPVKIYPWNWHGVTSALFYWPEPSQSLPEFKGVEKETPSPNERAGRVTLQNGVWDGKQGCSLLWNMESITVVNACFLFQKKCWVGLELWLRVKTIPSIVILRGNSFGFGN